MQVIVVGGSIAGLMIARVLKECGNDVKIIEKNKRLHSPAGISLGRNAVELLERFFPHSMPRSIENTGMVHFDTDGNITSIEPLPRAAEGIRTSSWNEVHQCLRRHIETGGRHWITGSVVVAEGTRVTEVVQEGESLAVRYVDQYGAYGKEHADLVVAADGAYSFVRQLSDEQMPPMGNCDKVRLPQYSECVAWRKGMCDEDDLPHRNLRAIVEGKIGFYAIPDKRAYFIFYAVPRTDSPEAVGRRIEWCWYQYCRDPSIYLKDEQEEVGHSTFAPDQVDLHAWKNNVRAFGDKIPAWLRLSMEQGSPPVLSKITSFDGTHSMLLNGNVLCVGEALQQITPHLGLASDLAAYQALGLRKVVSGPNDLRVRKKLVAWEKSVLEYGRVIADASSKEGAERMCGAQKL